jgi:hypothetical protein
MAIQLMEHNPLLKRPLSAILAACAHGAFISRASVEAAVSKKFENTFTLQTPSTLINILIRNGALSERVLVDGVVYTGSLQDLRADESIATTAHVEQWLSISSLGQDILEEYRGSVQLLRLLHRKPEYRIIYLKLLDACASEEGRSREYLEQLLNAETLLWADPRHGIKSLYPQFFIDSLEDADGIIWQGAWFTTEAGKEVLAQFS